MGFHFLIRDLGKPRIIYKTVSHFIIQRIPYFDPFEELSLEEICWVFLYGVLVRLVNHVMDFDDKNPRKSYVSPILFPRVLLPSLQEIWGSKKKGGDA